MGKKKDARTLLRLNKGASDTRIKKAYRQRLLGAHPDQNDGVATGPDPEALRAARDLLLGPSSGDSVSTALNPRFEDSLSKLQAWDLERFGSARPEHGSIFGPIINNPPAKPRQALDKKKPDTAKWLLGGLAAALFGYGAYEVSKTGRKDRSSGTYRNKNTGRFQSGRWS